MTELNRPIRECSECGKLLDEKIEGCWSDTLTPDHVGLCCDCFDVTFGMRPPVKLGLRTARDWNRYDDD